MGNYLSVLTEDPHKGWSKPDPPRRCKEVSGRLAVNRQVTWIYNRCRVDRPHNSPLRIPGWTVKQYCLHRKHGPRAGTTIPRYENMVLHQCEHVCIYLYCCTVHLVDSLIITQPTNALIVCHLFLNHFFRNSESVLKKVI